FLQGGDRFGVEAAPAQAFGIDADRTEWIARADEIRRNVLTNGAGAAYHGVRPDAYKLAYRRQAAQDRPVADMDMAGQLHAIGNDGMVAHLAIMGDMHIGHDPVVVAEPRHAYVLGGAGIDGDIFAHHVAVADFKARGFARIFFVLGHAPYGAETVEVVVGTHRGQAVDDAMRADDGTGAYGHMLADDAVGAYLYVVG